MHEAGDHPAGVGIDDGMPLTECECGDRSRCVGADAGQREELFNVARYLVIVLLGDQGRGTV